MTIANEETTVTVDELDEEQGRALFERACQRELDVSAEEFLAAYDAGSFPPEWDQRAILALEFLLPFAR